MCLKKNDLLQAGFAILGVVAAAALIVLVAKAGSRSDEKASSKLSNFTANESESGVFNASGFENPSYDENISANENEPDGYLQVGFGEE
jgi:hypothetical protein